MSAIPFTSPRDLGVRPRYSALPDGTVVEPLAHPLFSAAVVPSGQLPSSITFFGYGQGDQLPGATAGVLAKAVHTNMDKGGILSQPRHVIATGLRFFVPPVVYDVAGTPTNQSQNNTADPSAVQNDDMLQDMLRIVHSGVVTFEHQDKVLLEQPLYTMPGNYVMGGLAESAVALGPSNNTYIRQSTSFPGTIGLEHNFGGKGYVIRPQEAFTVKIDFRNVSSSGGNSLQAARLIYAILDGQQLRARR